MRYTYNGCIRFSRPLTEEEQEKVRKQIRLDWAKDPKIDVELFFDQGGKEFRFYEYPDGDIGEDLNDLHRLVKEFGTDLEESEITYYGDYDGAYVFRDGEWEDMAQDAYAIYSASSYDLLEELVRRGYDCSSVRLL